MCYIEVVYGKQYSLLPKIKEATKMNFRWNVWINTILFFPFGLFFGGGMPQKQDLQETVCFSFLGYVN